MDFFPLILLFAISVTGLALTVSQDVASRRGLQLPRDPARDHRDRRAAVPAVRQVLPHLPAPGAARREALSGGGRNERRRGTARAAAQRFASRMHIDDLTQAVLPQLGFDYSNAGPAGHWQELCPACKRKTTVDRATHESRRSLVAKPPQSLDELEQRVRSASRTTCPPGGWQEESRHAPDRLVKTHCCFCGQQCGIQLKVRDNRGHRASSLGKNFPFNRGMLCPKGVKRYLQGDPSGPAARSADAHRRAAFARRQWDEALDFTARRLREIQEKYGKDSVAVYGGASLTTEKSYLLGQVRARGARHAAHRLQRTPLHGFGGHRLQAGVRTSTARRSRGATSRRPTC